MTCRWDREAEAYLVDGEPCRTDDYGDPTVHCTARRICANHIGRGEITCARCVGRARAIVRRLVGIAPLLEVRAIAAGVDSEALNLAGPAADAEAWSWRKITAKQGRVWHVSLMEEDDDFHPYTVLTRWEFMLREDYDQPRSDPTSVSSAGSYLERILHRMAQDPEQDFPLFAREVRKCLQHVEAVLQNSQAPERGAPCPDCLTDGRVVKLSREYPHYCEDADCERMHYADDSADRWVCPRGHWRSHEDYQRWIEERSEVAG
jgi:hypothetical protein